MPEDATAATGDALWVSPLTFLKASSPGSGGWTDNSNQRQGVEHTMPIETPEDLAKIGFTSPSPRLHLAFTSPSPCRICCWPAWPWRWAMSPKSPFSHAPLIGDAVMR